MTGDSKEWASTMHLIVDTHCGNIGLMTSRSRMRSWLRVLAENANMHIADEPYIKGYEWPGGSDHDALTCFQPLMESGIVVHCYPEKRFIFIDVFSCRDFNCDKVLSFIKKTMRTLSEKVIIMYRGTDITGSVIIPATVIADKVLAEDK